MRQHLRRLPPSAETRAAFKECMDDDFNTAGAMVLSLAL